MTQNGHRNKKKHANVTCLCGKSLQDVLVDTTTWDDSFCEPRIDSINDHSTASSAATLKAAKLHQKTSQLTSQAATERALESSGTQPLFPPCLTWPACLHLVTTCVSHPWQFLSSHAKVLVTEMGSPLMEKCSYHASQTLSSFNNQHMH